MATNLRHPRCRYLALLEERGKMAYPTPVKSALGRKNCIAASKPDMLTMQKSLIQNPNSAQSP